MFDAWEEQRIAGRGSAILSAQTIVSTLLGLGFFVLLARILGPLGLGLYAAAAILAAFGTSLGGFGLASAAARFAAFLDLRAAEPAFRRTLLLLTALASVLSGAVLFVAAPGASLLLTRTPAYADLFRLAALLVAASIAAGVLDGWMQGRRAFGRLAAVRLLAKIVSVGAGVGLVLAGFGVAAALGSLIIYQVLFIACIVPRFAHGLKAPGRYPTKEITRFAAPIAASNLAGFASGTAESLLIVALLATPDLGVYNVALTVGTFLAALLVGPLMATVLPASSRVASLGRGQGGVFSVASRYATLFVLPASLGIVVLARPLVLLVGGPAFTAAVLPSALIAGMTLPVALSSVLSAQLQAEGRTGRVFLATALPIPVALGLGVLLMPSIGLLGAALARVALYAIALLATGILARGIVPMRYDWGLLGRAAVASAAFALPLAVLEAWSDSLWLLPVYALLGLAIYVSVLRVTGTINGDDRRLAQELLPRRLAWLAAIL